MTSEEKLLRRYSVRRKAGGSWFMGDRWEILFDGRNDYTVRPNRIPYELMGALTQRSAIRKVRRIVRRKAQLAVPIPLDSDEGRIPQVDARAAKC